MMYCLSSKGVMVYRICTAPMFSLATLLIVSLALVAVGPASAQVDPFGTTDMVYVDSVASAPGENVTVSFHVRNDEALGSLSIPVTYDTVLLTLQEISFAGSRVEYLNTKIITPGVIEDIAGHFVVV
ncbi:hypothetical protein GF377_04075, partial [candidate division GN15 bacterium]|nr:hypothetical protein [candidate division GN15 bacterium]